MQAGGSLAPRGEELLARARAWRAFKLAVNFPLNLGTLFRLAKYETCDRGIRHLSTGHRVGRYARPVPDIPHAYAMSVPDIA
eukprot:2048916-Rhodomonas_salina.1